MGNTLLTDTVLSGNVSVIGNKKIRKKIENVKIMSSMCKDGRQKACLPANEKKI